jgi:hypothetical protein
LFETNGFVSSQVNKEFKRKKMPSFPVIHLIDIKKNI